MTLYVVERWLARLSTSPHADKFIIKGGMLLAAYDARRPTADLDALARAVASDQDTIVALVSEISQLQLDDGVEYHCQTATARIIRDQAIYSGVRITMDCAIATAIVKFRIDVNFGDPITPGPQLVELPSLRPGIGPVRVLGYPLETVLAEKIATAIALGPANTRVRDYADIYMLTGRHHIVYVTARNALIATATYRGTPVRPLSDAVGNLVDLRGPTFDAFRASLGATGLLLPDSLQKVVYAVVAFADAPAEDGKYVMWRPTERQWTAGTRSAELLD